MKKAITVFAVISLITVCGMSCKKDRNNDSAVNNSKTAAHKAAESQIRQLRINAQNYKAQHGAKITNVKGAVATTVTDMGAVTAGLNWGWKIGAFLGNPVVGAGIGGLVGALGASAYAHWIASETVPTHGTGTNWGNTYTNQYEQVGYYHDQGCIYLLSNNNNIPLDANSFADLMYPQICSLVASYYNVDVSVIQQNVPLSAVENILESYTTPVTADGIMQMESQYNSDQSILSYNRQFITDLLSCDDNDATDIYGFIDAYTSMVNSDASLTSDETTALLNTLQVGRYSYALWSNN